ncbi:DNA replication factor C, large subunit [Delitschia confertaspora ATCC 74209]|uniref:Replication factor C subunit 1 n=1 Tax=Delitschia confertaspora ATCC 74209 TaxID=1513339 RepID=A0A9P4JRI8_9PLEO|nr:DNA replication factor C, large subunit [Delitschia confertaspora ATCC 74209]
MPADIRSFFGGGASQGSQTKKTSAKTEPPANKKKPARATRVIEDSEDEEEVKPKKATPKKPAPKKTKREPSPEGIATTTTEFFGSKNKPKRSEVVKTKANKQVLEATPQSTPKKTHGKVVKPATPASASRTSARAKKPVTYAQKEFDEDFGDNDLDEGDIFEADFKNGKKGTDDYEESSEDDFEEPSVALPHRATPRNAKQQKKPVVESETEDDVEMVDIDSEADKPKKKAPAKSAPAKKSTPAGRKRKTPEDEEDQDEEEKEDGVPKKTPVKKAGIQKSPAKKKAKKDVVENADIQAIYDSIPTIRPPTPPPPSGAKFDWRAAQGGGNQAAAPVGGSSEEMPTGAENCLAGLTFVFTGIGEKWGRTEAQELVKRFGGKVTTAPSRNTKFVVLGTDAGPSKLRKIKELGIKTINEDGLAALIRTLPANGGDSKAADAFKAKQDKEAEKIKEAAAEMDKAEKQAAVAARASGSAASKSSAKQPTVPSADTRLWTTKYAPSTLAQICGNKAAVEKLQRWLARFPKSQKTGFKLAGPDGSGVFRAVMIHGPPGIGKTTAAHLVAQLEGYDIVESNASDTRSKKLVEEGLRGVLSTTSLHGYFAGEGKNVEASKKKLVLIMDEVDGMSAGDRGGVGALAAVCKKSEIPMILICNERKQPKMKPFDFVTYDLPFRRPTVDQIRSRIMTIAYREGLKMPPPVVNALIEGSHADIRQVVNMISTAKLDQEALDFNKGKEMSKAWEKHVILKPWDITSKILGGGMFAESSKETLNDKIELYFNDHEFSYLMLQENYLGTNPIGSLKYSGREKNLKMLELVERAAESISDGDLVDRMIHGSQQHWSLMPTHAVFSFVRPASFIAGSMSGNQTRFTSWLGKNSAQQKLTRYVKEIQAHMRLRSSGDRHEVRQQYVPMLWQQLVKKLEVEGKDAVPEIIDIMDSYFLTKDDFDAIMELGVGPMDQEKVKLETQAKSTFTRLYNQQSHPLPFMKASNVVAPKKATKEKPDLEEAIDESDEDEAIEEVKDEDEELDLSKDKYVKQPKKKKAPAKKAAPQKSAAAKGKGKRKAVSEDEDGEESEEEVKPKGRGKGKAAATRGRGKK